MKEELSGAGFNPFKKRN
jgi:hypothetical protein